MATYRYKAPKCYYGYHKDAKTLIETASGGLATALSQEMIKRDGIVYGVVYAKDFFGAEYKRCENMADLDALKGSKYVDVSLKCEGKDVCQMVRNDLESQKEVLFIGLPCKVAALLKSLENIKSDLIKNLKTVDLICHGPTHLTVSKEFVDAVSKKGSKSVTGLEVRYKKNGNWKPPYLKVDFSDSSSYLKPFAATNYGFAFRVLACERCFSCRFKGTHHKSDITIGDFWGIKSCDDGYNKGGVSVAFAYNDAGYEFINSLSNFNIFKTSYEFAVVNNPYYEKPRQRDARQEKFEGLLKTYGLSVACRKCMSLKEKTRKLIPQMIIEFLHRL